MKQHQPKWKILIGFLVCFSTLIGLAIYKALGVIPWVGVWVGLTKISFVSFSTWILWECFRRWFWRWPLLQGWLVDVPDISGRWEGELHSSFVDDAGNGTPPMPVRCEIVQRFNSIHIRFFVASGSSTSHSVVASFMINEETGRKKLIYSFENESDALIEDLDNHFGTAVLEIEGTPPNELSGYYLNNRRNQSKGKIVLLR